MKTKILKFNYKKHKIKLKNSKNKQYYRNLYTNNKKNKIQKKSTKHYKINSKI